MNENYGPGEDDYGRNPSIIDILIAKKNYMQAVREYRKSAPSYAREWFYILSSDVRSATNDLQRLGIEPNYSLIAKELRDGKRN